MITQANMFNLRRSNLILNILISWAIVSFGQPAWVSWLAPCAAIAGYALFWISCRSFSVNNQVILSGIWFTCVQFIQLSWMTSMEFQGIYILFVYFGLSLWQGLQFALLTFFILRRKEILAGAALWTLLEWSRLSVLCGFTWNPIGLSLAAYLPSLQFSAIWGIYGLSFWVMMTNLAAVKAYWSQGRRRKQLILCWGVLSLIPVCFGFFHLNVSESKQGNEYSIALVQTGLLPSQKVPLPGRYHEFISPFDQWKVVIEYLSQKERKRWDLIVLPEAVVPFAMAEGIYPHTMVNAFLCDQFGSEAIAHFPVLEAPFAKLRSVEGKQIWCVSNAFWAQWIANFFQAEVVAGLDHRDVQEGKNYNSAFHFYPQQHMIVRYDKQVLLPLAEYLPLSWLKRLTQRYGISEFFTHGEGAKVIQGKIPLSLSICYEETFSELMREGRLLGGELFVNVTNDNYYPNSRLPRQHFDHARLRAVENGVPLIRACNTGITGVVDRFGRVRAQLGNGGKASEWMQGVLDTTFNRESHFTLYSFWGDAGVIALCLALLIIFLRCKIYFNRDRLI